MGLNGEYRQNYMFPTVKSLMEWFDMTAQQVQDIATVREKRHILRCCYGSISWLTGKLEGHNVQGYVHVSGDNYMVSIVVRRTNAITSGYPFESYPQPKGYVSTEKSKDGVE